MCLDKLCFGISYNYVITCNAHMWIPQSPSPRAHIGRIERLHKLLNLGNRDVGDLHDILRSNRRTGAKTCLNSPLSVTFNGDVRHEISLDNIATHIEARPPPCNMRLPVTSVNERTSSYSVWSQPVANTRS